MLSITATAKQLYFDKKKKEETNCNKAKWFQSKTEKEWNWSDFWRPGDGMVNPPVYRSNN